MLEHITGGAAVWIVEINVLGRRFTREMHARRPSLGYHPRPMQVRFAHVRDPRPAA